MIRLSNHNEDLYIDESELKILDFELLINYAQHDVPEAMFELAMRFGSGQIEGSSDYKYVYWLNRFLSNEKIQDIVADLDDEDGNNEYNFDFYDQLYHPMIIEAGISLGLYYKNSSDPVKLEMAISAFYDAYVTSKFDYIEIQAPEGMTDIQSLLGETKDRLDQIKGRS